MSRFASFSKEKNAANQPPTWGKVNSKTTRKMLAAGVRLRFNQLCSSALYGQFGNLALYKKEHVVTDGAHLFRRNFLTHCSVVGACGAMALPLTAKEQIKFSMGNVPLIKDFELLIGTRFEAEQASGSQFEMELSEVIRGKHHPPAGFPHPFSLVFHVLGQKRFPQDVYMVKHHLLGSFEQLLVPVDLPAKSNNLQAVFC